MQIPMPDEPAPPRPVPAPTPPRPDPSPDPGPKPGRIDAMAPNPSRAGEQRGTNRMPDHTEYETGARHPVEKTQPDENEKFSQDAAANKAPSSRSGHSQPDGSGPKAGRRPGAYAGDGR